MAIRMQQRHGTAAQWYAINPVLASGELGYEEDTHIFRIGDGVTPWNSLPDVLTKVFIQPTNKSIHLRSDASRTADTARLRISSYQKQEPENTYDGGEGIWMDLADPRAKNMITWRLPIDKVNRTIRPFGPTPVPPNDADYWSIIWAGAHYYAQDQADYNNPTDVHGHWSVETPDSTLALRTRFEIKFVGPDGKIGADKTIVQTESADLVVDASNDQVFRLRSGQGAEKSIEWANDQWGLLKRWRVRTTGNETGSNAGSDWGVARYGDASGTSVIDEPLAISRQNGRVTIGGAAGTAAGLTIKKSSAAAALTVDANRTGAGGATAIAFQPLDAVSRALSTNVAGEATSRHVIFADGKQEWGPGGTASRDVNLYRDRADVLRTDDAFKSALFDTPGRPSATTLGMGAQIYDITLKMPLWSDGSVWRNAAGAAV